MDYPAVIGGVFLFVKFIFKLVEFFMIKNKRSGK